MIHSRPVTDEPLPGSAITVIPQPSTELSECAQKLLLPLRNKDEQPISGRTPVPELTGCWGLALPAVEKLLLLEDELEALPLGLIF